MKLPMFCLYLLLLGLNSCDESSPKKDTVIEEITTSQTGKPLQLADPYVLCENGVYYAYGTNSDNGIEVYTSTDLANWKYENLALHKADSYADRWFWAPEVYNINGQYYMFYSADEHICVATSKSPKGPFIQDEKKPILEEKCLDTSLFIDDNGTPYLYFARFIDGETIWVAEMNSDLKSIKKETLSQCLHVSEDWEKSEGRVVEGPSIIKRNGTYFLLYSANGFESKDYGVGYATASSPMGPWTKYAKNPILQKVDGLVGTGHGAPFIANDGTWKYIYHAHKSSDRVQPRLTYVKDLGFSQTGEISITGEPIRAMVIE